MLPRSSFENSFVALLAEFWAELEAVLDAAGPVGSGLSCLHRRAGLRVQALKLELVLLAERCDSARWQALLGAGQIERLRSVAHEMLALLDFSPHEHATPAAQGAIIRAQDYLFDEVCRVTQAQPQWLSRTTAVAASEKMLHTA